MELINVAYSGIRVKPQLTLGIDACFDGSDERALEVLFVSNTVSVIRQYQC